MARLACLCRATTDCLIPTFYSYCGLPRRGEMSYRRFGYLICVILVAQVSSFTRYARRRWHFYGNKQPLSRISKSSPFDSACHRESSQNHLFLSDNTNISPAESLLAPLFQNPEFWSVSIMLSIVALLFTWEETVKSARRRLSPTLMPVVDSMLGEMGGLGFVGLFLGLFVTDGILGDYVGFLSERWLGDEEILLSTFEFLHTAFFEVAIAFFVIVGLTVAEALKEIDDLTTVSAAIFDTNDDGEVCMEDLADVLEVETMTIDSDGDGDLSEAEVAVALRRIQPRSFLEEIAVPAARTQAEALVVRERFLQTGQVKSSFRIEDYFEKVFAHNLEEIVELSPLTWLPLIPAISLGRSIDLARDVVSSASANAAESSGYFLGTPVFFVTSTALTFGGLGWGLWNFWKMTSIKQMLYPVLVRNSSKAGCRANILPPRYRDQELLDEFDSSPFIGGWIETFVGKPARNDQERLFGVAGAAGPEVYRRSIKLHTWLNVALIVFYGGQIVARDLEVVIFSPAMAGIPENLLPELAIFAFYVSLAVGQLWLAPQTFLKFCLVTSVEALAKQEVLDESCHAVGDLAVVVNATGKQE